MSTKDLDDLYQKCITFVESQAPQTAWVETGLILTPRQREEVRRRRELNNYRKSPSVAQKV